MTSSPEGEQGGALVFLDCPSHLVLGVDYAEWKPASRTDLQGVSDNSKGVWVISGILPGAHFAFWSSEKEKRGFFIYLLQRQVVVLKWNCELELFFILQDEDEIERYRLGHEDLSLMTKAVVFPSKWNTIWSQVSLAITQLAIDKIQGHAFNLTGAADDVAEARHEYAAGREDRKDCLVRFDDRISSAAGFYNFTDLPRASKLMAGQAPAAITSMAVNRSHDLQTMLKGLEEELETSKANSLSFVRREHSLRSSELKVTEPQLLLLAELQMSYIAFLLGADFDAFEQYKNLLGLLTSADELFSAESKDWFGAHFLSSFYSQLDQAPDDLMLSDITQSNFFISALLALDELIPEQEENREAKMSTAIAKAIRRRMNYIRVKAEQKFEMSLTEMAALQQDAPILLDGDGNGS